MITLPQNLHPSSPKPSTNPKSCPLISSINPKIKIPHQFAMNILTRAKLSPAKRAFQLHPITVSAFQRCNFFATKATYNSPKTQQITNFKTQKSSESPSSKTSFTQRVREQTDSLAKTDSRATVWPKPREIPYQAKVANFVNLIGYVKTPVQFEAANDGTHLACVVISQGNEGGRSSLLIPVVFEGDLAHVVACHVKENDCVFVSGQLSVEPMRLGVSESLGKFHVVGENLNFVEGLKRVVSDKKMGRPFLGTEIGKPVKAQDKSVEEELEKVRNDEEFDRQWKNALGQAKEKRGPSYSWESSAETKADVEVAAEPEALGRGNEDSRMGNNIEKGGLSVVKKKDGEATWDLWRDLVKNPLQWWDYREHKSKGLVKEKFPDFKQKETDEPLWVNSAPAWVLPGLGKLEFDVKALRVTQGQGGEVPGERRTNGKWKGEDLWKDFVEDPSKWWDNRVGKRNPRSPDFKHKETGEGIWLGNAPSWAVSKLPPLKNSGT